MSSLKRWSLCAAAGAAVCVLGAIRPAPAKAAELVVQPAVQVTDGNPVTVQPVHWRGRYRSRGFYRGGYYGGRGYYRGYYRPYRYRPYYYGGYGGYGYSYPGVGFSIGFGSPYYGGYGYYW